MTTLQEVIDEFIEYIEQVEYEEGEAFTDTSACCTTAKKTIAEIQEYYEDNIDGEDEDYPYDELLEHILALSDSDLIQFHAWHVNESNRIWAVDTTDRKSKQYLNIQNKFVNWEKSTGKPLGTIVATPKPVKNYVNLRHNCIVAFIMDNSALIKANPNLKRFITDMDTLNK